MLVITAINEVELGEILKKIEIAQTFSSWVHLDITDGKFVSNITWNNPEELKKRQASSVKRQVNFEVHLMVESPEDVIKSWILTGVKRIVIQIEAIDSDKARSVLEAAGNVEIGLAVNPETPIENLFPYLENFKFVLVLGVNPGLAGRQFNEKVLEKIKFLKNYYPNVIIEADGGINLETARLVKEAGADIIVSASHIWGSSNPQKTYNELAAV
ncbi:MAG: ribulose-phosphate 3-epimerase [Patescibacteria group bacterium]